MKPTTFIAKRFLRKMKGKHIMFSILKNKVTLLTIFSIIFSMNILFADPENGCELDGNTLFLASTGDVFYNSDSDIAGFQLHRGISDRKSVISYYGYRIQASKFLFINREEG